MYMIKSVAVDRKCVVKDWKIDVVSGNIITHI